MVAKDFPHLLQLSGQKRGFNHGKSVKEHKQRRPLNLAARRSLVF